MALRNLPDSTVHVVPGGVPISDQQVADARDGWLTAPDGRRVRPWTRAAGYVMAEWFAQWNRCAVEWNVELVRAQQNQSVLGQRRVNLIYRRVLHAQYQAALALRGVGEVYNALSMATTEAPDWIKRRTGNKGLSALLAQGAMNPMAGEQGRPVIYTFHTPSQWEVFARHWSDRLVTANATMFDRDAQQLVQQSNEDGFDDLTAQIARDREDGRGMEAAPQMGGTGTIIVIVIVLAAIVIVAAVAGWALFTRHAADGIIDSDTVRDMVKASTDTAIAADSTPEQRQAALDILHTTLEQDANVRIQAADRREKYSAQQKGRTMRLALVLGAAALAAGVVYKVAGRRT